MLWVRKKWYHKSKKYKARGFGIVGEYLGRIFNETKNRPLYLVDEYNGEKETNE